MRSISISLFARHKDIDRASALLDGTQGWHITGQKRTGNRKDIRLIKDIRVLMRMWSAWLMRIWESKGKLYVSVMAYCYIMMCVYKRHFCVFVFAAKTGAEPWSYQYYNNSHFIHTRIVHIHGHVWSHKHTFIFSCRNGLFIT